MVECPICGAGNPPGAPSCLQCGTSFAAEGATVAMDPAQAPTLTAASPDAETVGVAQGAVPTGWSLPVQRASPPDPAAPLSAGDVLGGRYEILKALGEGGMGAVYKARDRELDRLVALKVIRPELASHPDILKRFKQELILARQVTHRNVIRIYDLGVADGRKFITMEFIEGRDLRYLLAEQRKFPPAEALPIVVQVTRGLEAAHNEGVIHRDLKPQNIMVDAHGRAWVMDFGLARSLETAGLTRTGALMGTPDYMSPEQARAEKADARSDIFSLGIIFYELLTGKRPFQGETLMATLLRRTRESAAPPRSLDAGIPQELNNIVMKCLEREPGRRYQSAGELLQALASPAKAPGALPAAPVSLEAGQEFGRRYRIEAVIGEGGMGRVYRAHDNDLGRTVALKIVRPEFAGDANSMERFKQELLLASKISHKNILRIHDLGDAGGTKFISMAYVDGCDLHDLMQQEGRLPLPRAVSIASQLCQALEAAHAEGVVHRDLKPRNVLVDKNGNIYVSDFGLAKSVEGATAGMTRAGEVVGTARYMSPEQAESKPVDARSDIYSLGIILYEMVSGAVPFDSESTLQAMYQRVTQKPKDPRLVNPELPDYLAAIILRCLEKEPADRYQHAREVWRDLEIGAPPKRSLAAMLRRRRWTAAAAAAVVLAAAALAIPAAREQFRALVLRVLPTRESIAAPVKQKYLAILPFRVPGDDPALKYTAEGVVEALTAKLFPLKEVYMASPAAVEKVSPMDPPEKIARTLGVKLLVQGTVQGGAGDRISIVVRVDDVPARRRVWTQEFPGLRQDLLTIQNQIYTKLVDALEVKRTNEEMTRGASRPTEDIGAYDLYLRGRNTMRGPRDVKRIQAAIDLYNQAIRRDPRFALAYTGLSDAGLNMYELTRDGAWTERALGAAQQALRFNEALPEVHFALGSVYRATGKTNESIAELKRALELGPNSDDAYRRLGAAYLAAGRKADAIQAARKAVEVNPYYFLNHNYLGSAYYQSGENDKAVEAFQRVTELEPDNASGYLNLGVAYFRQGRWNDCVGPFQKALQLQPSYGAFSNLGVAQFYLGQYAASVQTFEKAVAMNPNQQFAVGNLADAYRWAGQRERAAVTYDRAIALALKALEVNPRDAGLLGNLAEYHAKKGDSRNAQDFVRRARAIDANDSSLVYKEAVIHALARQKEEALRSLREAFQRNYSVTEAMNDPELKELRTDPAFARLAAEFNVEAKKR